jgi:hypothetical protein
MLAAMARQESKLLPLLDKRLFIDRGHLCQTSFIVTRWGSPATYNEVSRAHWSGRPRTRHPVGIELVGALVHPSGRDGERSELKRAFCSSLSES